MSQPPASRPPLAKRLLPIALIVACGGVAFGVSLAVKLLLPAPPAEAAEGEADEEYAPVVSPLRQRLDVAVKSGNYLAGVRLARELLAEDPHTDHAEPDHDHPPADLSGLYMFALCLEGLERYDEALEEYERLAAEGQPAGVRAVAACGEVRCHLAEGETAAAAAALHHAEELAGDTPGLQAELAYLRGRIAFRNLPPFKAGPFAPDQPMGPEPNLAPAHYPDWLPLPASAGGEADPHAHADAPPADPVDATAVAFAAVLAAEVPHPDEPAVRLASANLLFRAGNLDAAAREYKRLREAHPPQGVLLSATYNLGLVRHRKGEWAVARQLFAEAADMAPTSPPSALAWWWLGRTLLDTGDADGCRLAWVRADEAADKEVASAVLVGKVFLLLLAGESERAAKLLHGKKVANSDPQPEVAEAFACYFRYADSGTASRGDALAAAVRRAGNGRPFGPAGEWLFGGWLGEVGQGDEMAAVYERAAEAARGRWAVRFALATADHLLAAGKTDAAARRFAAVAAADAAASGDRARVRLAEIALRQGRPADCVRYARAVLARDHEDRDEVLRLLGRGYEMLNHPRAAAECFAGRLPRQ
jgi:tetratricopeptide (TPR) repeat protein